MGKNKGGRPPYYKTPEEMQTVIDKYFEDCKGHPYILPDGTPLCDKYGVPVILDAHPPTITGLALALGFSSRRELLDYQGRDAFTHTVTHAKARVQEYCERRLFDRDGQKGAEFVLRCNFGWVRPPEEKQAAAEKTEGTGVIELPAVMDAPKSEDGAADA